ncbi:pentapeptide repeat-containing protein [Streptomyces sp. NBC_00425]|uniref:pentapeptide repeat-containing protein n=1 Tax=Streptomyces sp. NBC_00425 TaxID=2975740 RepID=UPI002E207278
MPTPATTLRPRWRFRHHPLKQLPQLVRHQPFNDPYHDRQLNQPNEMKSNKQQQIEVVRTALAAGAGVGAAITVLLTFRRQQHHEEATERTDYDASERRITELYTKAVEQLGSDQAPVRLGGLHALERLGQSAAAHRQTIVDVICAYLRMPYTPPAESDPNNERRQELQVRKTAERILRLHLCDSRLPVDGETVAADNKFWDGIRVDLSHATLLAGDFSKLHVGEADFTYATFTSATSFEGAAFTRKVSFEGAEFIRRASFSHTTFYGNATFDGAVFTDCVDFLRAGFTLDASFRKATFTGGLIFDQATVAGDAWFRDATLARSSFGDTKFLGLVRFESTMFTDDAWFREAKFADEARFSNAVFTKHARFPDARFKGKASFDKVTFGGNSDFFRSQFASAVKFTDARFKESATFHSARFAKDVSFHGAKALMTMSGGVATCSWPSGWEVEPTADGWATFREAETTVGRGG